MEARMRGKKQAGFTIAEFLVAMTITLIVTAAAFSAYDSAVRVNETVALTTEVTGNLRASMNYMVQDLIQTAEGIPTGGIPIPSNNAALPINRPGPPGAALTFPLGNAVLPALEPGPFLGPVITPPDAAPGGPTDIVTILYADNIMAPALNTNPINRAGGAGPACAGTISANGDTVTFDPACMVLPADNTRIRPGDLIMFSNANGNALQNVTGVGGQVLRFAAGDPFSLNGRNDPQGTILQLFNADGTLPPTTATRIWMISYYLDNVTNPGQVRLVRQVNFNPGQPVGEAIEDLQMTYNFVDGVVNPSNQRTIPAGETENFIRTVNLFLAARSNVPSSRTRRYFRNNLATQVSLRSLAYVSRYN
jgi:type II secretory pathway pseudopilin PulG